MSLEAAVALVDAGQRFLVTCHRRPDADALGSALGFAAVIRAVGKETVVYTPDALPLSLRFLAPPGALVHSLAEGERFDATFIMDTASPALLPRDLPPRDRGGPLVVVDHHSAHEPFGDVEVRDVAACATGEVILKLAAALGVDPVPADAATPIYAAIVADTGGFRYAGTKPATLRLGAALLEAGADPWVVAYNLFEGWEAERLRLLGAVLDTLETHCEGKLAILRVTRAMLAEVGADDDMVEGMVNYGRMLRGVEIAALLWEFPVDPPDGTRRLDTKVSLRSRGKANVAHIAVALGGGGHAAAAGTQMPVGIEEAERRVREEAERLLR